MEHTPGFGSNGGKGFHIKFPNGLTLSTQFGGGNYGSNYDIAIGSERNLIKLQATTVEIAIFDSEGTHPWRTREIAIAAGLSDSQDEVMGYVNFETWLRLFDATRAAIAKATV